MAGLVVVATVAATVVTVAAREVEATVEARAVMMEAAATAAALAAGSGAEVREVREVGLVVSCDQTGCHVSGERRAVMGAGRLSVHGYDDVAVHMEREAVARRGRGRSVWLWL